jgi:hypothetical protein
MFDYVARGALTSRQGQVRDSRFERWCAVDRSVGLFDQSVGDEHESFDKRRRSLCCSDCWQATIAMSDGDERPHVGVLYNCQKLTGVLVDAVSTSVIAIAHAA